MSEDKKRTRSSKWLKEPECSGSEENATTSREVRVRRRRQVGAADRKSDYGAHDEQNTNPGFAAKQLSALLPASTVVAINDNSRRAHVVVQVIPAASKGGKPCGTIEAKAKSAAELITRTDGTLAADLHYLYCAPYILANCANPECNTCNFDRGIGHLMTIVAVWFEPVKTEDKKTHMCMTVCRITCNQSGDNTEARLDGLYCKYPASSLVKFETRSPQGSSLLKFLVQNVLPPTDTLVVPDALHGASKFYNKLPAYMPVQLETSKCNRHGNLYFKYKVVIAEELHKCGPRA